MFLQKIENYLKLTFLLLLLFTQALIFVAVGARDNKDGLLVSWLEPISGQALPMTESMFLEAYIENPSNDDFSSVYFTVENLTIGQELNFEADYSQSGTWRALASLNTIELSSGYYQLSATAQVYDSDKQLKIYQSDPYIFWLEGSQYQAAYDSFFLPVSFISPAEDNLIFSEDNINFIVYFDLISVPELEEDGLWFDIPSAFSFSIHKIDEFNESGQPIVIVHRYDVELVDSKFSWNFSISDLSNGLYKVYFNAIQLNRQVGNVDTIIARDFLIEKAVDPYFLEADISSPEADHVYSSNLPLRIVLLNRDLDSDLGEAKLVAKIKNASNNVVSTNNLNKEGSSFIYSGSVDVRQSTNMGQPVYPNGAYTVEFVVLDDADQELLSLGSVNFSVNNETAEELEEDLSVLMLLSPLPGEPIMEKNFTLNLDTPLYSSGVKAQFYNSVDPAISTGEITIPYFDGYSWTRVIYLDDSFVNGDYILKISLLDENGLVTYTESFGFSLTLGSNEFLFDPSILELKLINLETNISGTVFPVVLSSFDFSSADIYLEIVSSVNEEEKINLPVARTIWETLAAWGFSQSDFVSTPHAYLATLDTSRLANGNYRLLIKNNLNPDLSTGEKLISIFNTAVDQDQAEDLEEVGDLEEELIEDFSDSQPADPEFLIGDLRLEKKFLIYQNKSCLELGIEDKNACQRFMATIQFFDQRCLSQSIFDAPSCEDYLRRLKVDGECQEAGIDDPESCKDYLLEKYAFSVDCRLLDNLFCADILRNQQLNRLVLAKKNQMEMETILGSLIGQTVSTQELGQKIESVGLSKNLLSLAPQAETKVLLVRAESQVILYSEEILAVSGGSLMMIDSDGDGLPDDLERYYGTDPYNPDTDGDGYFDGLEVMNNYNPLGDGPLLQERLFFAELLFAQVPLEQPKFNSARINEDLDLASLENLQNRLRLAGKAEPDTWLLLYLYSDLPMVMLTKTDASGNWYYDIERPLNDGYHKFYVTVNDDSGKIVSQSRPVSFFIKEAQAVAVDEYFDVSLAPEKTQNFLLYYIIGGVFLILLVLGIIIILRKHKKTESGF